MYVGYVGYVCLCFCAPMYGMIRICYLCCGIFWCVVYAIYACMYVLCVCNEGTRATLCTYARCVMYVCNGCMRVM